MIEFSCQQCGIYLNVRSEDVGKECSCPKCNSMTTVPVPQPTPARGGLTGSERFMDALKMFGLILLICFVFMGLLAPLGMILMVAVCLFVLFFVPGYLITTIGTNWLHRDDPHYQAYRRSGGQPYLDNMGFGQSVKDYHLPYQEPNYDSGFVPPRSWGFQCLTCYARVERPSGQCWNCGIKLTERKKRFPLDP